MYRLVGCPPGYELVAQECLLCPASSYCLGGSAALVPCPDGLFSNPGSNSSSFCRQVVHVFTAISFSIFISEFSDSDQENLRQSLASVANVDSGDVQEVSVSEAGFGKTLAMYKFATLDAVSASHLRLRLIKFLSNVSSSTFQGLPGGYLQSVTLSACPPGFVLQLENGPDNTGSDGLCELCLAGYYCEGGSKAATPCPPDSFSFPGSNSSISCTYAVFIIVTATLPIPYMNFTSSLQQSFITALALASGSDPARISIASLSVDETVRRVGNSESKIVSQIAATGPSSAEAMYSRLDSSNLNYQLALQGLPAASLDSVSVLSSSFQSSSTQQWVVALAIVCGLILFLLLVVVYIRLSKNNNIPAEDLALKRKTTEIRQRLSLMPKDGFFLNSERRPFWSRQRNVSSLRSSHLEAAGRVALFRDYDKIHFDAFCLSLYEEQDAVSKKRYQAFCQWLLELSENLINPDLFPPEQDYGYTTVQLRFRFFVQKLGKARIWIDDEGLFQGLKAKASLLMDKIATECDLRCLEIFKEPRGQELVAIQCKMQMDQSDKWVLVNRHILLRTFVSRPFSASPPNNSPTGTMALPTDTMNPIKNETTESSTEKKRHTVGSACLSSYSTTVLRQDHEEVRS